MRTRNSFAILSLASLLVLIAAVAGQAAGGKGTVTTGYVVADEEGNLSVNQETFNTYEGYFLSLTDFRYQLDNGVNLAANLERVTLNNRQLSFSAYKSGLFSLSVQNNQYRRINDFDGNAFTRRRTTSVRGEIQPHKNVRFFGGYSQARKHGDNLSELRPIVDTVRFETDYFHHTSNAGTQLYCPYGSLWFEWRRFAFQDDFATVNDREANSYAVNLFSSIPSARWFRLAGGFRYREDKMDTLTPVLTTNTGWGAVELFLPRGFYGEYRLMLATTEHETDLAETDNTVHTVTLGKKFRKAGIRGGYEIRTAEDAVDKTTANVIFAEGWCRFLEQFTFRGKLSTRTREVDNGVTLVGDEDYIRGRAELGYTNLTYGGFRVYWEAKDRTWDELNSQTSYNSAGIDADLKLGTFGKVVATYGYYIGEFENGTTDEAFEFTDHVVTGMIYPAAIGKLSIFAGGTFYTSTKDTDIEKIHVKAGARFEFMEDHWIEGIFNGYTYDDLLIADRYYTGNIIEINLIRELTL